MTVNQIDLQGVIPVMLLPLADDESVDETAFRRQVDFAIERRAAGVCAPAFATEFYKLTDEERRWLIRVLVEQARGRALVLASTGCGSVRATIELSHYAESLGADALLVAAPKWCALGVQEQMIFFENVCREVSIPVMLQDADFTGSGLAAATIAELAEHCPNLRFAKLENVLAGGKCSDIIRLSGGKVGVLYGMGGLALLDGLAHGAIGVMPGPALIEIYDTVIGFYASGRTQEAKTLFDRVLPYIAFAMQHLELAIQMEKRLLVRRKVFSSPRLREPTLRLDTAYQGQMDGLIADAAAVCERTQAIARLRGDDLSRWEKAI